MEEIAGYVEAGRFAAEIDPPFVTTANRGGSLGEFRSEGVRRRSPGAGWSVGDGRAEVLHRARIIVVKQDVVPAGADDLGVAGGVIIVEEQFGFGELLEVGRGRVPDA